MFGDWLELFEHLPESTECVKRLTHRHSTARGAPAEQKRDFLRCKFPALSKAVTARHKHYQGALRKKNAERLRSAIKEAVRQLIALGQYVSERRVKNLVRQQLPQLGRDSLFKQALREVKAEIGQTR